MSQHDVLTQLLADLQMLEQTFEQQAAASAPVTADNAAIVREALLRLHDSGALEQYVQHMPHEILAQALGHAQRAAASVQRLYGHMPATQPALANLYHLVAVLERHAWQDHDRDGAPARPNLPYPLGGST